MYHPYFRGKQYELVTIKEMSPLLARAGFRPIIEPVRNTLTGLKKALDAVAEAEGRAIVIVNPHHGELSRAGAGEALTDFLRAEFANASGMSAGILLGPEVMLETAMQLYKAHADHTPSFIHAGFKQAKALRERLGGPQKSRCHIFLERFCGKLYQRHFKEEHRVLLRDGFERKRNADYSESPIEPFSDLHATFRDEGMKGFGDFLTVGDDYTESGGPAYAVAIHLTFIDPDQDEAMQIHHFVSESRDTPKDPAGKFAEALEEMVQTLDTPESKVLETGAVKEFRALHKRGHFPGLGYVKKLSMNHHIETLAKYFQNAA
ncbi:MAG: sce7725 family protein [Armatimonadetes bacterium]|nr:sce7725 family protein [Armatimonadota bacterium]